MEREILLQKLEAIFETRVTANETDANDETNSKSEQQKERISSGGTTIVVHGELSQTERELIALILENGKKSSTAAAGSADDDRMAQSLSDWIMERLSQGDYDAELPETFTRWPMLAGIKVPLLVYGEHPDRQPAGSDLEIKKLLKSFFESKALLIPLHPKMFFILADASLLSEDREGDEESQEESLAALASGLQDMVASEWMGECHVATGHPFSPAGSLVQVAAMLQETIELGRAYRLSSYVHLPWELRLETLLDAVPKRAKTRFLENVLRRAEPALDPEMLQTLESFFSENCNVSDTAKRLYIHRNTLLYRLDKFKQETGMDVRDFEHAVLVRLALLLYKVTKRK